MQVFLSRLNDMEQTAGRLPGAGNMFFPRKPMGICLPCARPRHSWGNDINSSRANYNWDGMNEDNDFKQTRDVGMYAPNPWGFFDMHGNIWEWVYDWKADPMVLRSTLKERRVRMGQTGGSWGFGGTGLFC